MSYVIYQASSLRAMVRQLLPCAESKNISESNYCNLGIMSRKRTRADGSTEEEQLLYAETHQPSFSMGLGMVLTTEEVEADNENNVRVLTRDLDNALASFGQRMVHMTLQDGGNVLLCSVETCDENNNMPTASSRRMICVQGEEMFPLGLPDEKMQKVIDFINYKPSEGYDTCILADKVELLDSLRFSAPLAATRGNGPRKQGVMLNISPENMHVEGANLSMHAIANSSNPWLQAPRSHYEFVLSPDSVRHLLSTLSSYGDEQSLTMMVLTDEEKERPSRLIVHCDTVEFIMDC